MWAWILCPHLIVLGLCNAKGGGDKWHGQFIGWLGLTRACAVGGTLMIVNGAIAVTAAGDGII